MNRLKREWQILRDLMDPGNLAMFLFLALVVVWCVAMLISGGPS